MYICICIHICIGEELRRFDEQLNNLSSANTAATLRAAEIGLLYYMILYYVLVLYSIL